jgi:hypothetical protein
MIAVPIHRRTAIGALAAGVLLAAAATVPAYAQDELVVLETVRTTTYVNGGIGKDEEAYMRRIVKDWSLRMIFSEHKDNEFVADVNLLVTDMRGAPVLVLPAAGIDLEALADNLQSDGAAAFVKSWHELLSVIAAKSKALA